MWVFAQKHHVSRFYRFGETRISSNWNFEIFQRFETPDIKPRVNHCPLPHKRNSRDLNNLCEIEGAFHSSFRSHWYDPSVREVGREHIFR